MKKIYILLLITIALMTNTVNSNGAIIIVNVSNFAFTPANFTLNSGDTIIWHLSGGTSHTTTSTSVPAGANTWDQTLTSSSQVYEYIPTVAGAYNYVCTFHSSMVATFTVITPLGIPTLNAVPELSLISSFSSSNELNIAYTIPVTTKATIVMNDILGKSVQKIMSSSVAAGIYTKNISIANFPKGIYILELMTSEARISKKIVIQ